MIVEKREREREKGVREQVKEREGKEEKMRVRRKGGRTREKVEVVIQVKWNTRNNGTNLRNREPFIWMACNGQQLAKRSKRQFHSPFMTISCMEGQCNDHACPMVLPGHD